MGNNRANIVTIKVTSDHVVKSDIAIETIYCAAGDTNKDKTESRRVSRPKSWNLQVPSSDRTVSLDHGRQQRPRSSSSHRQRHSSNESCRTTVSDSGLYVTSRNIVKSRSRNSSPRLSCSSDSFGSNTSITSLGIGADDNTERFYLRVPRRPTSCNPLRPERDLNTNSTMRRTISTERPKSWCSTRDKNEFVPTVEESSKSNSEQNVKADGVLDGKTISHFYKIWNITSRDKVLGRGKLELPNSLKRQEKYRPCGCRTRHHVGDCTSGSSP